MNFNDLKISSMAKQETNDCTVKAWAVTTGDDYDTAHYIMADVAGRRHRAGPRMTEFMKAYQTMGYSLRLRRVTAKTMVTLGRELAGTRGGILVITGKGRHAVGVLNGRVVDWTEGRRNRVYLVFDVVKDGEAVIELPTMMQRYADVRNDKAYTFVED